MSTQLENFKRIIREDDFVVLDTETTGIYQGEIVQIAIIDSQGETLLDTLVKPVNPIPLGASAVHGITGEMVSGAPCWSEILEDVSSLLFRRNVVVYNAVYDRKMMYQSAEALGLPRLPWKTWCSWWCAMEAFAEVYGDWNSYHRSYHRWQRLATAVRYYGLKVTNEHTALGDCLMTLAVCKKMAAGE